ncbi:MAG: glycosyltransferase family 2 protein [Saprospiraceae bacterium]|nr:glycosyltransferase family 2 protein [Saprospiraceae bacterium]
MVIWISILINMPFFSIIIPTYNRAHTIRRPVDSIIAQTFTDWELIIVDDGSTDDTKEIVESYKDPRIRYVWQENQERSAARNHGISLAKGEWICFQDSDDKYLPEHLQVLYDGIQTYPDYKVIRTGLLIHENGILVGKSAVSASKYDQYPYEGIHCCAFEVSLFSEGYSFDLRFVTMEDLEFLLQVGRKCEMKQIQDWTVNYYYDPKSSGGVGPHYEKNLNRQKACLDDILTWNKTLIIPNIIRKRCLNEILMLLGHTKYKKELIWIGMLDNIKIFKRFPLEYIKLVLRILYVKIGESSGLYRTQGRF